MITLLNEELYSFSCIRGTDPGAKKPQFRLTVSTSNKLVKETSSLSNRNHRDHKSMKDGVDTSKSPNLKAFPREVLSILTPSSDNSSFVNRPISLKVTENMKGTPMVACRCLGDDEPNKANIFVIAYPFNGMLKPIPEDPKYHIYKGLIATSDRRFMFNGKSYRKILYLVVEPHMRLFDPEHKYHVTHIPITIESYALFTDRDTGKPTTTHSSYTLDIVSNDGMYTESWDSEDLDYEVDMQCAPGQNLWTTFRFNSTQTAAGPRRGKSGHKEGYVRGGTYITSNKNGIRKEVPLRDRGGERGGSSRDRDYDMFRQCGDYDDYDEPYNHGKDGKRGKKHRR